MAKAEKSKKPLLNGPHYELSASEVIDQIIKEGVMFDREDKEGLIQTRDRFLNKHIEKMKRTYSTTSHKPT